MIVMGGVVLRPEYEDEALAYHLWQSWKSDWWFRWPGSQISGSFPAWQDW
jgi:hypothetical protein